ncbi:MAG: PorT family protein [Bacteroidales bacterium]|nr:PorT family protein [Bacteroidales bacterium]
MKKFNIVIILTFLFTLILNPATGQRIRGAVIGGFNLTQVDGDEVYGFHKAGIHLGASAIIPFGERWMVSLETIFNQKGSTQGKQYSTLDSNGLEYTGEYKLKLDYLEVPVLVHYNDRDRIIAGAGISYGRLVNVKEWEHGRKVETTTLNTGPYKLNDLNILADVRFRMFKKLYLNFRYAYSLIKIRTRVFDPIPGTPGTDKKRDQYNNVLSFRLIYVFNERVSVAEPDEGVNARMRE